MINTCGASPHKFSLAVNLQYVIILWYIYGAQNERYFGWRYDSEVDYKKINLFDHINIPMWFITFIRREPNIKLFQIQFIGTEGIETIKYIFSFNTALVATEWRMEVKVQWHYYLLTKQCFVSSQSLKNTTKLSPAKQVILYTERVQQPD